MQYTTCEWCFFGECTLCYQDFKDTFVCNTQHMHYRRGHITDCVIRISKILLYAIHNCYCNMPQEQRIVLSGFQRYFCMQYTTVVVKYRREPILCYQDFKDTFVCNTQHKWRINGV